MMTKWMAMVAVFVMTAAACLSENPGYQQDPNWQAPVEAAKRPNPLAKKPQLAGGGRKLFLRNCVECHGEDGRGLERKHSADLHLPVVQSQSDGTLFWKITNGNQGRGMPSFSQIPDLQRWQIVLYLRTLSSAEPPGQAH
jgi:mono/diheme cytochrome c family protein